VRKFQDHTFIMLLFNAYSKVSKPHTQRSWIRSPQGTNSKFLPGTKIRRDGGAEYQSLVSVPNIQILQQWIYYEGIYTINSGSYVAWGCETWRPPWCFRYEWAPGFTIFISPHTHHSYIHNNTSYVLISDIFSYLQIHILCNVVRQSFALISAMMRSPKTDSSKGR